MVLVRSGKNTPVCLQEGGGLDNAPSATIVDKGHIINSDDQKNIQGSSSKINNINSTNDDNDSCVGPGQRDLIVPALPSRDVHKPFKAVHFMHVSPFECDGLVGLVFRRNGSSSGKNDSEAHHKSPAWTL